MHAIIFDRNKQYYVEKGLVVKVDFLNAKVGETIEFNDILFFSGSDTILVGDPFVKGKTVISKVINNIKDAKKIIVKFKRRKHHMKKMGHRQKYTLLEVMSIEDK